MNDVVAKFDCGRAEAFGTGVYWSVLIAHVLFVGFPFVWRTRRFAPANQLADANHVVAIG